MEKPALHDLLCEVMSPFSSDGKPHCYFQPPDDMEMKYPCIVYNRTNELDFFADNIHYQGYNRYTITVIDEDPDSKIPNKLKNSFLYCISDRNFVVDGLNHFVYTLFYSGPRIKEENKNG